MNCCQDEKPARMTMQQDALATEIKLIPKVVCEEKCDKCKNEEDKKTGVEKKALALATLLLISISSFAQEATGTAKSFSEDPFNHPLLPLYLLSVAIGIVIILILVAAVYVLKVLNVLVSQVEKERALKLGIAHKPKPTWWDILTQKLNASVPVEREESIDLGHDYDGIRELDNHLPPWWTWLFIGTIGWAAVYLVLFHVVGTLPLSIEEYTNEVANAEKEIQKLKASQPPVLIDENTLEFTHDATLIAKGKAVFMSNNCGTCHRNDGGGNSIGPNLTDNYWVHGGSTKDIFNTIKTGVVEKGMPAWGKLMSAQDVRDVTFFVMSLNGTNPVDAKAPQGELYKAKPAAEPVPVDTVRTQAIL